MQSESWLPDEYYLTEFTLALYTAENVQGGVKKTLLTINSKRILQHFFFEKPQFMWFDCIYLQMEKSTHCLVKTVYSLTIIAKTIIGS